MENIWAEYSSEIITGAISFTVAIITTIVTHFLGNFRLRYTEKMKIISELSKKKYEGISKIREEIVILSHYEDLCITEDEDDLIDENIGNKQYTPSCCYAYEDLLKTARSLNDLHSEYGYCLRHTSVIYLVYIRNFLKDYAMKCKRAGLPDEELRWASVPLYPGMLKWFKMFDKELIKSMNKPSTKYFAHSGIIYSCLLNIYGCYFKKSFPYKYMNDEKSCLNLFIRDREKICAEYDETIIENAEQI